MNVMRYRDYFARVEFDADDRCLFGRLVGINDVVGFHADTVAGLEAAFHEAVDDYLATCALAGKAPERPFSGQVMFRIGAAIHQRAALAADLRGLSLNQWAAEALDRCASADLETPGQRPRQMKPAEKKAPTKPRNMAKPIAKKASAKLYRKAKPASRAA